MHQTLTIKIQFLIEVTRPREITEQWSISVAPTQASLTQLFIIASAVVVVQITLIFTATIQAECPLE
jgi:hypothetical protein